MGQRALCAAILAAAYWLLIAPPILTPTIEIFDDFDERMFHHPTVQRFAEQFPAVDPRDYPSATGPLYHLVLAAWAVVMGDDLETLRFVGTLFSFALVMLAYRHLSRDGPPRLALLWSLLILSSPYFIGSAIRLSTDNAALLFGMLAIFALEQPVWQVATSMRLGLYAAGAILIRQNYAWLIGAAGLSALRQWLDHARTPIRILVPALLIPSAALLLLLACWGGLTPPSFKEHVALTLYLDAPIYTLSLLAVFSGLCAGWLLPMGPLADAPRRTALIAGGAVVLSSLVLAVNPMDNRYPQPMEIQLHGGPLWVIASKFPTLLGTGILFWVLLPAGVYALVVLGRQLIRDGRWTVLAAFLLWLAATAINLRSYQKYYEPFLLLFLAMVLTAPATPRWRYAWLGPGLLLAGFLAVDLKRFFVFG